MAEPRDPAAPGEDQPPAGEDQPPPAVPYGSGPASTIPTAPVAAPWSPSETGSPTQRGPIVSWEPSRGPGGPSDPSGTTPGPGAIAGWAAPSDGSVDGRPAPVPGYAIASVGRRLGAFVLDNILLIGITLVVAVVLFLLTPGLMEDAVGSTMAIALVYVAASLLLVVGGWTGAGRASPGMRVAGLQVIAAGGGTLPIGRALGRWVLLGYPVGLLSALPELTTAVSALSFVWVLALLITTATNALGQGLHDRLADSLVVRAAATEGPPA